MTIADLFGRYLRRSAPHGRWSGAAHTPLERLPLVAIDCETTGLDPRRDRIVSFAAIRIDEGLCVAERPTVDILINPGIEIPTRATAIHGLDRAHLADAPTFAEAFEAIAASLKGVVVVGHHVGFDLAIIDREAARARLPWHEPPHFDTASLAAALGHPSAHIDLAELLGHLGIEPSGRRHSAAGDARMAADLFVALAHRLIGRGHGTYGGVATFQRAPRR
ncbi:MAG: 3'-5' exonuclease [Reyranella sp.]|uniref:3'-5' exonuclease n=1 Tax=Reyranella sp. TaxID=1929291 RepID=UPI00121D891E|nr:3'-5' exonuclease [Reyranella sp.]TAJ40551.1 MAG: 3'-5' exonuclease [Reyranella sp.]